MPIGLIRRLLAALVDLFLALLEAVGLLSSPERLVLSLRFKNSLRSRRAPQEERRSAAKEERSLPEGQACQLSHISYAQWIRASPCTSRRRRVDRGGRYGLVDSDDEDKRQESPDHRRQHIRFAEDTFEDTASPAVVSPSFKMDYYSSSDDEGVSQDIEDEEALDEANRDVLQLYPWSTPRFSTSPDLHHSKAVLTFRSNLESFTQMLSSLNEKVH